MFDKVYRIAIKSNDFEELKRKLKKLHIDALVINKNGLIITAPIQLAIDGSHAKVEWMRKLGANVDDIAYALAGDHEKVEFYRTQYSASADSIVFGYALANNHEKVLAYLTQHRASIDDIAQGYAQAGNHEKVEFYRTQHPASVDSIVYGYALVGNHEKVETYRTQHAASVKSIVNAYALAGNHEKVEFYRTQHGASVDDIAKAYELACNHEKQKKYDINCLLDSYLNERAAVTDSSKKTKEYLHGSFFSIFPNSFSFTQKSKAVEALKSALKGEKIDLSEHLPTLRNGNLGKELRAFIKAGMANVLVNKELTTVTDFVQALQDKNMQDHKYSS